MDIREFKKTTTATSCRTPPNKQNNKTTRAKYNLVGFSALLCKTTTRNEHFPSFLGNVVVQHYCVNNNGKTPTLWIGRLYGKKIVLESDERENGERNSFSKSCVLDVAVVFT